MPQTGMEWWAVAGVILTAIGVYFTWRKWRGGGAPRTVNRIGSGHRNDQRGGQGQTENTIERGNDNEQRGA